MRRLVTSGLWEIFLPDLGVGDRYKFEVVTAVNQTRAEGRSLWALLRDAAAHGVDRLGHHRLQVGRCRLDARPADPRDGVPAADVDLRGASRQLAAGGGRRPDDVSRDGRHARALCARDGLHAHRADAGDGASVHRIVGLSGHRLLRADQPLRRARRFQGVRRRLPSAPTSASSSIGSRAISRRTCTGSRVSMAPRSTSTPIRDKASIRTGAR